MRSINVVPGEAIKLVGGAGGLPVGYIIISQIRRELPEIASGLMQVTVKTCRN